MSDTSTPEEKFEEIVKITPAYDLRSKGRGIGACRMFMALKGAKGAVSFMINTSWFLACTFEWKEMWVMKGGLETWQPSGMAVSYCSPTPLYDWQKDNPRDKCEWLGCTCYGDTGYSVADSVFEIMLTKGSDAVFEWLKNYYFSVFYPTQELKNTQ